MLKVNKTKKIQNNPVFRIVSFLILLIYSALLLYLIGFVTITSFKSAFEFSNNKLGLPSRWVFDSYQQAFNLYVPIGTRKVYIEEMLYNTVLYCTLYLCIPMFAQVCVAYICAKYPNSYTKFLYNAVVFFMVVPVLGTMSGALEMSMKIGTYDNIWTAILFKFDFGGMTFLVLYGTFKGIPKDYMEAAQIDGAGHALIMFKIMLPMGSSVIMVYVINMLIGLWNDWNTALIWFPSSPTIAYGLYRFSNLGAGNTAAGVPTQCAAAVLAAIPAIVFFICFKNKIVGKLAIGGLKG